jgi:hypothetical protein
MKPSAVGIKSGNHKSLEHLFYMVIESDQKLKVLLERIIWPANGITDP